jgi:hypothetical protein
MYCDDCHWAYREKVEREVKEHFSETIEELINIRKIPIGGFYDGRRVR